MTPNDVLKLAKAACPDVEWDWAVKDTVFKEVIRTYSAHDEVFTYDTSEGMFAAYDNEGALDINLEGLTAAYLEIKNEKET